MKKRMIVPTLLLFLLLMAGSFTITTKAANSGYCGGEGDGTNLTWTLDSEGTLTISGTGRMEDYTSGHYSAWYSPSVKSVYIYYGVTSIGDRAFYSCKNLTSVTISDSVTSIGNEVFYDCSNLSSVNIGNKVTSIGGWAFWNCTSLTSVIIPDSVTNIGNSAFASCAKLTSIDVMESNNSYSSLSGVVFNKDKSTLVAYPSGLEGSYTVPDSVTSIGSYAFNSCNSLIGITIGKNVTSIGNDAFVNCNGLTSVTIPDSVTSIPDWMFGWCRRLSSVVIGNSVTSIGSNAFWGCWSLTSVTIPASVTSIEDAFSNTGSNQKTIYYAGSEEQWKSISKPFSEVPSGFTIHYELPGLEEPEKSLTFDKQHYTAKVGETIALSATFLSSHGPTDMQWFCDDTEAVSLVAGTSVAGPFPDMETTHYISHQMVGNKAGTYEITLTASGLTATTTLVISDDEVYIERSAYSISIDETGVLTATSKSGATIHWSVSGNAVKEYRIIDESIAPPEDDAGHTIPYTPTGLTFKFIGVQQGQATITASVSTGESASCVVTVEEGNPYYISLSSFGGIAFEEGKTQTIEAQLCSRKTQKPVDEDELKSVEQITWESSDGNVVAFDKEGHTSLKFEDNISHGFWGNNHDKVKLYGRGSGGATVSCFITINGYVVYSHTTVSVYSKDAKDIKKGVEDWVLAYDSYVKALEQYLKKDSEKGNALSIEEQGALLEQSDLSKPHTERLIDFTNPDYETDAVMRKYVYQAMAQFLADKAPNEFEKISVKDVTTIASNIVEAVRKSGDMSSTPYYYPSEKPSISVEIKNTSQVAAFFRQIYYNDKLVASSVSNPSVAVDVLISYVGKLHEMNREIVKQAYKEALKELFTKDISGLLEESVKAKVTKNLGEYASRFAETGVNDIVKDVQYCFDYYGHLKKMFGASASDPRSVLVALGNLDFSSNPDNIKDYTVKTAMKAIKKAGTSLESLLKKAVNKDGGDYEQILTDVYDLLFHFRCPVTIAVYSGDAQVGLLGEDDIWYDSDYVYIKQYGDEKNFYAHSGTALRFEVVGTDEGTLDYTVEEFRDGESIQRMNYYDIHLYEGKSVSIHSSGAAITGDDAIRSESEGQPIFCDETLTADDYETASVLISSLASPYRGGQVQGCGSYVRGDCVTLRAVPENGFLFKGWWSDDGNFVSPDRIYEFTSREDVSLTAMFAEEAEEIVEPESVAITSATLDKAAGLKVCAAIQCPENVNATVYFAFYKSNGQMVSIETESLQTGENDLTVPVDSGAVAVAKLFVLDEQFVPQCQCVAIEIS